MRVLPASLALTSGAGTQHRGEYCNPVRVVPLDVADPALHEKLCCESGLVCDTREHGHYKCVKRISKGCHEDQYASSRFALSDQRSDCGHEQVCIFSNGSGYCGKHWCAGSLVPSLTVRRASANAAGICRVCNFCGPALSWGLSGARVRVSAFVRERQCQRQRTHCADAASRLRREKQQLADRASAAERLICRLEE